MADGASANSLCKGGMIVEELSAVIVLQRILDDAVNRGASDVHLSAAGGDLRIQFRVHGNLIPFLHVPDPLGTVVRRVKALARMDVSDTRLPQDGAFQWTTSAIDASPGRQCDVRVGIVPTVGGETAVLRLFERGASVPSLLGLGMDDQQVQRVRSLLMHNAGMVLVAGSTGSGKTTTLYAMLQELTRWGRRVVSIEDPVEIQVPDWQQMEVREHIGVTFDVGIRAILRQDPDVIMIGEVRDETTARAALRAAMTGHLVLSTTHARDLIGAAARLVDLGLPRAILGEVLCGVVVQELTRAVCPACQGAGCDDCTESGYRKQRNATFQILEMDGELASLTASSEPWTAVRAQVSKRRQQTNEQSPLLIASLDTTPGQSGIGAEA